MPRRVRAGEWRELRDIRLRLLADVPWRGRDLAIERALNEEDWKERARVRATAPDHAAFVIEDAGDWVGIVELTDQIEGLWVDPAFRRRGLAVSLLDAAAERATELGRTDVISWVREQNRPAIAAHARAGFSADGQVQRWPDRADWQIRMVRPL